MKRELKRSKKPIPFRFVLELLEPARPSTRPMFGCTAIYIQDKIVMILREKDEYRGDNGVWLATSREHHDSLRKEFPNMRSLALFGQGVTNWQNLPAESEDFDESVMKACQLILAGDRRIGRIPQPKKRRPRSG